MATKPKVKTAVVEDDISLSQAVTYGTPIPGSNLFNPANITADKYINSAGNLVTGTPAGSYSTYTGTWDLMTHFIVALNGAAQSIFSLAQYDSGGAFIPGSYQSIDFYAVIVKATGAVTFKFTFRPTNRNVNQLNSGTMVLPYASYSPPLSYANQDGYGAPAVFRPDVTDPDLNALIGHSKTTEAIVSPANIYTVCNDLIQTALGFDSHNYSAVLYVDHFLNLSVKKKVVFKSNGSDKLPLFAPVSVDGVTWNNGSDQLNTVISDTISGDVNDVAFSVNNKSTLLSAVAAKFPKILTIGDSTVNGTGSFYPLTITANNPAQFWSYIKKLNLTYRNQKGSGFDCLMIGRQTERDFIYNGTTYKNFAEGRGGWKVSDYLYNATGVNGYTNYFYDASKVGAVKFSLNKYLSDNKTLADDGATRLVVGSTAGTAGTNVNDWNVCTPTHIVIQLGFNDAAADYQTNIPLLIAAIKAEYPNMIIIININDAAGTYYPELYPKFNYEGVNFLGNALHAKMYGLIDFAKALENTSQRTYICLNYFIQPTANGMTTREINYPEYIANTEFELSERMGFGNDFHPNTYAHASWAYHIDSLIKYTSYLYL